MKYPFNKLEGFAAYHPPEPMKGIIANANESFLPLDVTISREIGEAVAHLQSNRYPDPYAVKLCEGFGQFYHVDPALVTVGNGSDELLSVIICGFLQQGDCFLTLSPDFSMYPFYGKLSGSNHIALPKKDDLSYDVDEVIAKCQALKPKLFVLSNPCNPSSIGIPDKEMLRLVENCGCVIVVDEAYMDFWDESILSEVKSHDNLIVLKTLSKVGFAAFRLGFAVACEGLTELIRATKSPYNVNATSQAAGEIIFSHSDILSANIQILRQSRNDLYHLANILEKDCGGRFKLLPAMANFITILTENPAKLHRWLQTKGILASLNAGRYIRITCCAPEDNQTIINALRDYFMEKESKS